jgi:RNA polymerase sigma factor (sigma-70 family)
MIDGRRRITGRDACMTAETLDMPVPAAASEFADLVERHRKIVFKVAHAYCWREADRADLVQDILGELWRAFPRYDRGRPFATWVYRIALNVAISWLRRDGPHQRRTVPLDDHDPPDLRDPDADARVRLLYGVIDRLEPLDRALLLLHLDDHSHREVAGILGISETNVATKLSRLKQRIRRQIGARP